MLHLVDHYLHHSWLFHQRQNIRLHHHQYLHCYQYRHRLYQEFQLNLMGKHLLYLIHHRHRHQYPHCFQLCQNLCQAIRCSCQGMRLLHQQFRHRHDLCHQRPGYRRRRHRCQHCDRIRRRQHRIVR